MCMVFSDCFQFARTLKTITTINTLSLHSPFSGSLVLGNLYGGHLVCKPKSMQPLNECFFSIPFYSDGLKVVNMQIFVKHIWKLDQV